MEKKDFYMEILFEKFKDSEYKSFRGFTEKHKEYLKKLELNDLYKIYCKVIKYQILKYGCTLGGYAIYGENHKKIRNRNKNSFSRIYRNRVR